MSNSLQANRMWRRPAPGSIGLALVWVFYLGSQILVDRLGPDALNGTESQQMSQPFRLPSHPAFLFTLRQEDASRGPTAAAAGS